LRTEQERRRREDCKREVWAACLKARDALREKADALAAFGVAGASALGFVVLMRKPDGTQRPK
jgi:hypothetical protein